MLPCDHLQNLICNFIYIMWMSYEHRPKVPSMSPPPAPVEDIVADAK